MLIPIGDNIDRRDFPIVPVILIFANIFVFAFEIRLFDPENTEPIENFVRTWGLVPAELANGKVLGIVSHMFLHGGFLHILGNMAFLWAFSCSLEVSLGRWTLVGFYLLFGIAGGLAHALMNLSSDMPLVGASGAIAGLIGAYTVLYGLSGKIKALLFLWLTPVRLEIPAWLFGVGWFGWQIYMSDAVPQEGGGVAWYAHIGGFVAGVVIMLICRHDTECVVKVDAHGYVSLEDHETMSLATPTEEEEVVTRAQIADWILPEVCPHCEHPLNDDHRVTLSLAQCGNSSCGKMIHLESDNDLYAPVDAT